MLGVQKGIWLFYLTATLMVVAQDLDKNSTEKFFRGRQFSLFSVVSFKNSGCLTTITPPQSTARSGTCYTTTECSAKKGLASGSCASGFGVCCLFVASAAGTAIDQNCTYLRNPDYPSLYFSANSLTYNVVKSSSEICFMRLDFETFVTVGPTDSNEGGSSTYACPDTFKVKSNSYNGIPTICGNNTGQHIYADFGYAATDTASLEFTFSTTGQARIWEIKISQIACNSISRPPFGCLQYFTGTSGRLTTFNWAVTSGSSHLPSQSYSICIRREAGYSCVLYQVCSDVTQQGFSLDSQSSTAAQSDSSCSKDYLIVPGSSVGCLQSYASRASQKFCGSDLLGSVICDCYAPFDLQIYTDNKGDGASGGAPSSYSRGLCLIYIQLPY